MVNRSLKFELAVVNPALKFDLASTTALDALAQRATDALNYGTRDDWFKHFRFGLYGFYSRLCGVTIHYGNLYTWTPLGRITLGDYNVASFFFNAASALECFAYALNALGYIVAKADFKDITDEAKLQSIGPNDIAKGAGFSNLFPQVQAEWNRQKTLWDNLQDQNNVAKHRSIIFRGGTIRGDRPQKFSDGDFAAYETVLLAHDPKGTGKLKPSMADWPRLETWAAEYVEFVNALTRFAAEDAKATIVLTAP